MEVVVEGGVEEHVANHQRVLGQRKQCVDAGLAESVVAVEEVHGQQKGSH